MITYDALYSAESDALYVHSVHNGTRINTSGEHPANLPRNVHRSLRGTDAAAVSILPPAADQRPSWLDGVGGGVATELEDVQSPVAGMRSDFQQNSSEESGNQCLPRPGIVPRDYKLAGERRLHFQVNRKTQNTGEFVHSTVIASGYKLQICVVRLWQRLNPLYKSQFSAA